MMRVELTYEDAKKLETAYRYVNSIIEGIEKYSRERDLDRRPSRVLLETRQLLREVLYDE